MTDSPFVLMTRLMNEVNARLAALDIDDLGHAERKNVVLTRQLLADCRLDIRDYELSETRDEQLRNAAEANKRLEQLRGKILVASEHNIFSAIDIAQVSAELDEIVARLR
jgi:hypothetical protein